MQAIEGNNRMEFFQIVYNYTFVIQLLSLDLSLLIAFYPFKKTVRSYLFALLHLAVLFAFGTLLNWGLFELTMVADGFMGINFLLAWLVIIALYTALNRKNLVGCAIMGATLYVIVIAIGDFGRDFTRAILGANASFVTVCWYFVVIACSAVIRRFSLKKYDNIPLTSGILMGLNAVCLSALVYIHTILDVHITEIDVYYLASCLIAFIIAMSSYLLTYAHSEKSKEATELQVAAKLLEADKSTLIVSQQAIAEMHAIRHDIKNEFSVMKLMLAEGRYLDLDKYLGSMTDSFLLTTASSFIDCGNPLINSVINMEVLKANNYGIELVTKIKVPETLPFEDSDLCRIIVNLLDNAMEAVVRAKNKAFLVDVKIMKQHNYLYIGVQNELRDGVDPKKLMAFETEKEDSANHGFGHRIIRRIAKKYNGYANYTIENNQFIAEVMLDCSGRQAIKQE